MAIPKGSHFIAPGDKEVRNVYEMLLNYKEDLEEEDYEKEGVSLAILLLEVGMALEFVEGLL